MEEDVARVDVPILSMEAEALRGVRLYSIISLVLVRVLDEHIEDPT